MRRPLAGVAEVAAFFGIPEKSVRDQVYRRVGVGALAFKVGRYLKWDWDDLDSWIATQKKQREAA
ncbi:DNA-binding protein [Actinospica acidiphila]|nr:DNA-binding protein [Actinospica acidiphila]